MVSAGVESLYPVDETHYSCDVLLKNFTQFSSSHPDVLTSNDKVTLLGDRGGRNLTKQ